MGRSVDYLTDAEYVIYFTLEHDEDEYNDFDLLNMLWKDFLDSLIYEIKSVFRSYDTVEKWDNETRIFLENQLCEIGISEYCGSCSLSIRAKEGEFYTYNSEKYPFAKRHAEQIRGKLEKALENSGATLLNRIGTFSNGVGVYERA